MSVEARLGSNNGFTSWLSTTLQPPLCSNLAAPPLPLSAELLDFYLGDVRVRVAGPLARCHFTMANRLRVWRPSSGFSLARCGGRGDEVAARHVIGMLRSAGSLDEASYMRMILDETWADLRTRWHLVAAVAEALLERGEAGEGS
jgi:hypothetical protein